MIYGGYQPKHSDPYLAFETSRAECTAPSDECPFHHPVAYARFWAKHRGDR